MQLADRNPIEEGSPTKEPCSHIGFPGTADEQSAAKKINTTDDAGKNIRAGPVPLFLVPQTLSAEIHAHGGDISEITVRRTRHHFYAISLTRTGPQEKAKKTKTAEKAKVAKTAKKVEKAERTNTTGDADAA